MLSPVDGTLLISGGTRLPYRSPIYSRCGFIPLSREAGRFVNRTVSKNLKNKSKTAKKHCFRNSWFTILVFKFCKNLNVTNRRFLNLRNMPARNCFIRMDVPR